ncbi:hypothetical protein PALB_2150 [Pseudoalteromonas luteoviolacea B = ATCC 29581]|nr:hypothetical protein PALB_2150 [Pseudoalteromonas luteoviolacea B = ATCC 29581]
MRYKLFSALVYFITMTSCTAKSNDPQAELEHWFLNPTPHTNVFASRQEKQTFILVEEHEPKGRLTFTPNLGSCAAFSPHAFFDLHTKEIALAIANRYCQVFLTNTQHRHNRLNSGELADPAKLKYGLLFYAPLAYAKVNPKAKIYQFHGFSKEKRYSSAGKLADLILSTGNSKSEHTLVPLSTCLAQLPFVVKRYPSQVKELGGTKNVLAEQLGDTGQFVHVEMSLGLRLQLIKSSALMERFSQCFKP